MSENSALNEKIDKFILANPKQPNEIGYYNRIAELFDIHPEKARKRWRMLQRQGALASKKKTNTNYLHTDINYDKPITYKVYDNGDSENIIQWSSNGTGSVKATTSEKIENLQDLIRVCKIDTEKYTIVDYEVKSYNAWIKNKEQEIEKQQLFSVRANLKIKRVDDNLGKQRDLLLEEIKKYSPYETYSAILKGCTAIPSHLEKDCALEINIPDLHIGKLAWGKETGEDYDISIAIERYKKAVNELLARVNPLILEKIILPVGNDMINIDNKANTTTGGTPQSCDSRFGKMFQTAKSLLIETIDKLSVIAPVEVMIIPGNHDTVAMFTLGEVLDAWYHNNELVNVINTHTPRKYVQYGQNLIMYTHGHNEKLQDLGIICATEQPQLWAATKFRRVHVGHFHHSKQIKFTDVQEYPGFTVKVLNSLSSNDAWHAEKGYLSLKGAEAFLYHKDKGLLANFYYLNQ